MALRCDLCDDEDATIHCDDCSYNFCSLCSTAVHEDVDRREHAPYLIRHGKITAQGAGKPVQPAVATSEIEAPFEAPEVRAPASSSEGILPHNATQSAASPILAHRAVAAGERKLPSEIPGEAQTAAATGKFSQCLQCASAESFVDDKCQLCGYARASIAATVRNVSPQDAASGPPRCPSGGHVMVMSMGSYTCNLCGRHSNPVTLKHLPQGSSSRWSCASCGDDYCLECRPEGAKKCVSPSQEYTVGEYGLAVRPDVPTDPPGHSGLSDAGSSTPELIYKQNNIMVPATTRHAPPPPLLPKESPPPAPVVRCGLGLRLCHSSLGKLVVDSVLPGSTVALDGRLQLGDQILSINGKSTADLIETDEVARALVGEEGSIVHLIVTRTGGSETLELTLERKLFDDQFDSIHSGPTPRVSPKVEQPHLMTLSPSWRDQSLRPHSMPNVEISQILRTAPDSVAFQVVADSDLSMQLPQIPSEQRQRPHSMPPGVLSHLQDTTPGSVQYRGCDDTNVDNIPALVPPVTSTEQRARFDANSLQESANVSHERPHSMPVSGSKKMGTDPSTDSVSLIGPLSAPVCSKAKRMTLDDLVSALEVQEKVLGRALSPVNNSASTAATSRSKLTSSAENPAMALQERLDRAIKRTSSPLTLPDSVKLKVASPPRSETPIDELLAKYTLDSAQSRVGSPPPTLSIAPAAETPPPNIPHEAGSEDTESTQNSMLLVCQHCQSLYLHLGADSGHPVTQVPDCCPQCTSTADDTVRPDNDATPTVSSAQGGDRRSWGLAKILANVAPVAEDSEAWTLKVTEQEEEANPEDPAPVDAALVAAITDTSGLPTPDGQSESIHDDNDEAAWEQVGSASPAQPLTAPAVLASSAPNSSHAPESWDYLPVPDSGVDGVANFLALPGHSVIPISPQPNQRLSAGSEIAYNPERILRRGWLAKESGSGIKSMFMKSQKRWCVLKPAHFQYFHSETEDGRSAVISLGSIESIAIETKRNSPYLVIKTPQRTFMFTSPDKSSHATLFDWHQEITHAVSDSKAAHIVQRSPPASITALPQQAAGVHTIPASETGQNELQARQPSVNDVASAGQYMMPAPPPGASVPSGLAMQYGAPAGIMIPSSNVPYPVQPQQGTSMPPMPVPAPMSYARFVPDYSQRPPSEYLAHSMPYSPGESFAPPFAQTLTPNASSMPPMAPRYDNMPQPYAWRAAGAQMTNAPGREYYQVHQQMMSFQAHEGLGGMPLQSEQDDYDKYSSMYEHEAQAARTGITISADISPSMAAMHEVERPPPM